MLVVCGEETNETKLKASPLQGHRMQSTLLRHVHPSHVTKLLHKSLD